MKQKTYYDTLEVDTNASMEEILEAFLKMKNLYSNNDLATYSLLSAKEIQKNLNEIEEAYSIIGDSNKRALYNTTRNIKNNFTVTPVTIQDNTEDLAFERKAILKSLELQYTPDPNFEKEIESKDSWNGAFLKQVREYKNVTLLRMAQVTRISQTYLRNIEDEDFANLPAISYVRGFLVQYSKFLKLPQEVVVNSYMNRYKSYRATHLTL